MIQYWSVWGGGENYQSRIFFCIMKVTQMTERSFWLISPCWVTYWVLGHETKKIRGRICKATGTRASINNCWILQNLKWATLLNESSFDGSFVSSTLSFWTSRLLFHLNTISLWKYAIRSTSISKLTFFQISHLHIKTFLKK